MRIVYLPIMKILRKTYEELVSQPKDNLSTYCLPILF